MLDFKVLELSDMENIRPYFEHGEAICDNTPATQMMWRGIFKTEYCIEDETLVLKQKYFDGTVSFLMPLGKNIKSKLIEINKWCQQEKIIFKICFATKKQTEYIAQIFDVSISEEPDWADYLYNLSDLAEMKGKKYNGQRNHINAFKRTYTDYYFKPLSKENFGQAEAFFSEYNMMTDKDSKLFQAEQKMVYEALGNLDVYNMTGLCLYADGKMVGFTAGEILRDTLYVHIEKADTSVRGSYQMLVKEFAQMNIEKAKFVNREEDMGDEGLRKSKLSYQPMKLISKFTVIINKNC